LLHDERRIPLARIVLHGVLHDRWCRRRLLVKDRSAIPLSRCGLWLLAVATAGCTVVPAPVAGPGLSQGVGPGITWSVGWSRAHARIADAKGVEREIEGNGAHGWGDPDPWASGLHFFVPSQASLHLGSQPWDGGLYAGWRRVGLMSRLRLLSLAERATTSFAVAGNVHWRGHAYDGSAALEQTVPLLPRFQLLLRAGVGGGRRDFAIRMPADLDSTFGRDNTVGAAHLDLLRDDLRLEPVVALVWDQHVTLSFQPYHVLLTGAPRDVTCVDCAAGVRLLEFRESSGFAVAVTAVGQW
jgi:hypothetical protein